MRCPFVPSHPELWDFVYRLGILDLSFWELRKRTVPLYAVIHSSVSTTLRRVLPPMIASMGGVCFRNSSISRMSKSATQLQNRIPNSKLVCNFTISNLCSTLSNRVSLQIQWNIYIWHRNKQLRLRDT